MTKQVGLSWTERTRLSRAKRVYNGTLQTLDDIDSRPNAPVLDDMTDITFPTTQYHFPTVLRPIAVPQGHYPIEVRQYWRGEHARGRPRPLHWTIVVRTSLTHGNTHEIVGDTDTYAVQERFDVPLLEDDDWRGTHVVGYVSPDRMDDLWDRIAWVPIVRGSWMWNCQNWVHEALELLNRKGLYTDGNMTLCALQTQMCTLLEAWELGEI